MLFEILTEHKRNFACLSMPHKGQLAEDQLAIDFDLKSTAIAGNEGQAFDLTIKGSENFIRHTDGMRMVFSDGTIGQGDVYHAIYSLEDGKRKMPEV